MSAQQEFLTRDDELEYLDALDLADPGLYSDGKPYLAWSILRRRAPVWWQRKGDDGFWAVTSYALVKHVMSDTATYSSEGGTLLSIFRAGDRGTGRMLAVTDPPQHNQISRPIAKAMRQSGGPENDRAVRDFIGAILDRAEQEPVDVAAELALLPLISVGPLLGVDRSLWPDLQRLAMQCVAAEDLRWRAFGAADMTMLSAHHELFDILLAEIRQRRRSPSDDLISMLTALSVDGERLTDDSIALNCYSIIVGAAVTTPHVVTTAMLELGGRPDVWRLIDGNEEALRRTTEEATRWATPTSHFMRHARKDARLGGEQIRAGDVVTVWLASADRDGAAFPDPDTFDVHREKNAHFGYGHGTHYCSGAPIARTSITIALREIAARTERIEVAGPVTRVRSNFVHGYGSAWLSCTPRRDRRPA
jgi:cytochrome P450